MVWSTLGRLVKRIPYIKEPPRYGTRATFYSLRLRTML